MGQRVRGYLGMSLDGRIAGPDDDLEWLMASHSRPASRAVPETRDDYLGYDDFIADVGALLMGRRTYDVVANFDQWPYGELLVVVATTRPLDPIVPTVTSTSGTPADLVAMARDLADGRDVYADGGQLVSGLLMAGLLDELTTTILPTVHGPGIGLFEAVSAPVPLVVTRVATSEEGPVQLVWEPVRSADR